jgi:hypothetical protein
MVLDLVHICQVALSRVNCADTCALDTQCSQLASAIFNAGPQSPSSAEIFFK